MRCFILGIFLAGLVQGIFPPAAFADSKQLAEHLRKLDLGGQDKALAGMLGDALKSRRDYANDIESKIWHLRLRNKTDWEEFRDTRIKRLRESLGQYPPVPPDLKVRVTNTIKGDGFEIDNMVFESRQGLLVTANLYRPAKPAKSMPGILIIHSHHNPKTHGELQDMGMTWARQGCLVLVPDQLGHGERRQHPFIDKNKYPEAFKVGRQDYYFRYNTSLQLYLIGDSLMGWMAWDNMRSIDLLLQKGCDKNKIILLGSVAGGGDPAGVTAALDRRITAVAPFNFGGPQPETKYPLPEDAETAFNYAGGGSWESTRNLAFSCRDGFLPWVIVGSVAPRGLIHAHEFAWDQERDPVWKRYQKIFQFYGAPDQLDYTAGKGSVRGSSKEDTHCGNIGAYHRKAMHATFKKWFDLPEPVEYQKRLKSEDLQCLTRESQATPLHQLAGQLGAGRLAAARFLRAKLTPEKSRHDLRRAWADRFGWVEPLLVKGQETVHPGEVTWVQTSIASEADITVPLLLLLPKNAKNAKVPVVVAVAQTGKHGFWKHRLEVVAELLDQGVAVCLPDVRGAGASKPGDSRGRTSTSLSATGLMLGQPLLGGRLRDLRAVLAYLRQRPEVDSTRIGLWGDSFAPVNAPDRRIEVPWDAAKMPDQAEPLGGLLALFAALYEDDVRAVFVRGGLVCYQSVLESPFLFVPHDVIVPGALTAGDLADVAAALAPRPVRLEGLVDGRNRTVAGEDLERAYAPARAIYQKVGAGKHLELQAVSSSDQRVASWLISHLQPR